jgi:ketosteroid isomerase-like protein
MTRRTLLFALTLSATLAYGAPLVHAQTAADQKTAEAVKALDQKRFDAMTKNDLDTLGTLLADDLTYHHSSGAADSKAAYIETLRTGKTRYHTIEPSEVKVRVYGTTAIVTGLAKLSFTSNGQVTNTQLRYTDVWVRKGNAWQMVSWQSTRLPQP